ncbi:lipopolysaccharide heptosyltransferase family protein [Oxalobacteraceae bacterium CAVE-383]|nr:lipopolysaccharide heptosyltransferase family protein [Oxalobacteraceae bacterium CAVE-383]
MTPSLIPAALLEKSDKILFITHLALGDFAYLQNCFQAFSRAHPHLAVHLWVDEVRRTDDPGQLAQLKNYALYDWVDTCPFFTKIYKRTYSPALYRESIAQAQRERYPIVVSLATLRPHRYARLAREIGADGFVAGMKAGAGIFKPHHYLAYRKLDAAISPTPANRKTPGHISEVHADWFRQLSGLEIPSGKRMPYVRIPDRWSQNVQRRLSQWGFTPRDGKLVFINAFAKTKKRCWPMSRVADLIAAMQQRPEWRDACFIVNAMPEELDATRHTLADHGLARTESFSAEENFFQLPAMLRLCDLVISVETAVMHLANAVHVPVVAMMRTKNPEWAPIDKANSTVVTAARRRDWVDAISVDQVLQAIP